MAAIGLSGVLALIAALGAKEAARAASEADIPQAGYIGSATCRACHVKVMKEGWQDSVHSKAVSAPGLPQEASGCEACHGPGSIHVGAMGKKPMPQPCGEEAAIETVCARCHMSGDAAKGPQMTSRYWQRALHAQKDLGCSSCHKIHSGAGRALQQAAGDLCLSCHTTLGNPARGGFTHSPVAKGQCLLCHLAHGGAARHNLVDKPAAACLSCHPAGEALQKPHGQYAVEQANCLSCHDPHSFDRDKGLLAKEQHQPFAAGKCEFCHRPSEGSARPELIKPQKQLCLTCHAASKLMPAKTPEGNAMTQHPPAQQGMCTSCHNPHASTRPRLLRDQLNYVCFFCHSKIEDATQLPLKHAPVASGHCELCHQPHASAQEKLLTKAPLTVCEPCHKTEMQHTHPVGMRNNKPVLDPNTKKLLVCARCHAVHGSKYDKLLPQEADDLCRGCHVH